MGGMKRQPRVTTGTGHNQSKIAWLGQTACSLVFHFLIWILFLTTKTYAKDGDTRRFWAYPFLIKTLSSICLLVDALLVGGDKNPKVILMVLHAIGTVFWFLVFLGANSVLKPASSYTLAEALEFAADGGRRGLSKPIYREFAWIYLILAIALSIGFLLANKATQMKKIGSFFNNCWAAIIGPFQVWFFWMYAYGGRNKYSFFRDGLNNNPYWYCFLPLLLGFFVTLCAGIFGAVNWRKRSNKAFQVACWANVAASAFGMCFIFFWSRYLLFDGRGKAMTWIFVLLATLSVGGVFYGKMQQARHGKGDDGSGEFGITSCI